MYGREKCEAVVGTDVLLNGKSENKLYAVKPSPSSLPLRIIKRSGAGWLVIANATA